MKSVEPKINKAQFARAVQEGYYDSRCSDPMIRYSVARGFHVESKQHSADDDVIWSLQCLKARGSFMAATFMLVEWHVI